ncbi:MAG: UDP-2,3-diacylglucosamine diphosphatase [Betaproteobacteria bacterium]|nr:MAG: UDP-2,3-diacylglucosamine diphosphatase [Betaproteobacteria bacterium]
MPALFISDLHLSEERPAANERFIDFLEGKARSAQALYILGDLFEYWIGDDDLGAPFNAVMAGMLRALSQQGVALYLMHGNRDFLMGERFCAATGATLLRDPSVHDIHGVKTLLVHGDTLCTDDHDYQAWRRTARSPEWQREFLARPRAERRRLILGLREKSKAVIEAKPADIMDVNAAAVADALRLHGAERLVHGHTHRPGQHRVEVDGRVRGRWVLPDWYGAGGYLEIGAGEPRLVKFKQ